MAAALCRPSVIPRAFTGPSGIPDSQSASSAPSLACWPGYCDKTTSCAAWGGGGYRISEKVVAAVCELPIQRQNGIQSVMHRDMHHGVRANAFKGEKLILCKRDLVDRPVPDHDQRRIQKEDMLQLNKRGVLVLSLLLVRKALIEVRLRLLCHSYGGQ
jgi:hypothetical protein